MINTIKQKRVADLIINHTVEILDITYCTLFDKFITDNYPWDKGYGDLIDWEATSSFKRIKDVQLFSAEAQQFVKNSCAAKYEYLAIVYGCNEPGVIGKFEDILNNLNLLSSHTPWVNYLVGAKKNQYGIYELINKDFIEVWTGKCTLTAPDLIQH